MKNLPFIPKMGLFYKIAFLVLLTLIIAIGVSTAVSIREQTKTIKRELIGKNKAISEHLASSVKSAFWSLNWLFVEKQMQEITKSEDVTFLELIKPNGEVYLSSGDKKLEENVLPPILMNLEKQILKEGLSPKTGGSIKLIITPFKIGSDKWTLVVGLSLKEVEEAKKRILKNNIIWGSTIFLLGVFLSFFLARGLTKPIKQLVEGTMEIGKGNLDYRINIKSLDELGTLADSFNDMAEGLKKTTTSRDQLAIEVNERKQAEEALKASLKEKEVLLRELYHRTRNNMNVIRGLLTLQSANTNDKQVLEIFRETDNRIMSMGLVHKLLYQSKDLSKIDLKHYIATLADALFKSYRVSPGKILLNLDTESIPISIDTAAPCGLIINELMSNCLKHAFPENREGEIRIGLHLTDEDEIELRVGDNGIGIPQEIDLRNSESLGLKLITDLAERQLGGKVELKRGDGTEFVIRFKELQAEPRI